MRTSRFSPMRNRATQRHILNATKNQPTVAEGDAGDLVTGRFRSRGLSCAETCSCPCHRAGVAPLCEFGCPCRCHDPERADAPLETQRTIAGEFHARADAQDAAKAKEIAELPPITRTSHWTWAARVYRIEIHDGERKHVLIAERATESSAISTAISQDHLCIVEKWNGRQTVRVWTGYKPPKVVTERCEGCSRVVDPSSLAEVDVLVAKQTHSSPAEYETYRVCDVCRDPDADEHADYERANQRFKEETGSEL